MFYLSEEQKKERKARLKSSVLFTALPSVETKEGTKEEIKEEKNLLVYLLIIPLYYLIILLIL